MRYIVLLIVGLSLAISISACGKKGQPKAPGESSYPNTYPAPSE